MMPESYKNMPLANCLFFIHIPKTAGTSLRLALEEALGKESICYDYGPSSSHTEPDIARLAYPPAPDLFRLERALTQKHYKLLGGHVPALRYLPMIPAGRSFTFIRNPVDQLVSHYEHHVRNFGYSNTLKEFIKTPAAGPICTKMLAGVPLGALGFVGVTEEYDTSLTMLSSLYGLQIPVRYDNRNPTQEAKQSYIVDEDLSDDIATLLEPEFALWHQAQAMLHERQKAVDQGYDYINGGILTLNRTGVTGFAYRLGRNNPIRVGVRINGKQVKKAVTATLHRPSLQTFRPPRNGCVGFEFQWPTPLQPGDEVTCFVPVTGQVLEKRLFSAQG